MLREDRVVLADEGRHEGGEKVHADLQAAGVEGVGDGRDGAADDVAFGHEESGCERALELRAPHGVEGTDGEEGVAFLRDLGFNRFDVNALGGELLAARRAAAAEHAADAADEGLRADAVEEDAVEAAVGEALVVEREDVGRVLRRGGAVEAEAFALGEVEIGRLTAPEVHRGDVVADFLRLREDRQPEQHVDAFGVQRRAHLAVNVFVEAPADDDLADGDHAAHGVEARDDLVGGI